MFEDLNHERQVIVIVIYLYCKNDKPLVSQSRNILFYVSRLVSHTRKKQSDIYA